MQVTISKVKLYYNKLEIGHGCEKAMQFHGNKVILGNKSKYIAERQLFLFQLVLVPTFFYECYI